MDSTNFQWRRAQAQGGARPVMQTITISPEGKQYLSQNFFDNLVLTSEYEYMDTVGFEFSLVDDVERFLELLTYLATKSKILKDYAELPTSVGQLPAKCTR